MVVLGGFTSKTFQSNFRVIRFNFTVWRGGSPEEKHVISEKDTPQKDDCVCCLKEQGCRVGTTCLGLQRVDLFIPLNQMAMQQMFFVISGKLHSNMNEGSVYPNICRK